MDDHVLLREYVLRQSEPAFAELVGSHLPRVYATALRLVRDPHMAEDVAQTVFIRLARKAWTVREGQALSGWLYRTAQRTAFMVMRGEVRRRKRETLAMTLAEQNQAPEKNDQLAPLLDEAMGSLNRGEQDAMLLRFFENKSYADIGTALGLNEDAIRKRVDRALEKMRRGFARRGVQTSAALLSSVIAAQATAPLPPALAGRIVANSLTGAADAAVWASVLAKAFFMSTRSKIVVMVLFIFLVALVWTLRAPGPRNSPAAANSSPTSPAKAIPPVAPPAANRIELPAAAPFPVAGTTIEPKETAAPKTWTMGEYKPSSGWADIGADTPESALQTIYWARKTGNQTREIELMFRSRPKNPPTAEDDAEQAVYYRGLRGVNIADRRDVSADVVEIYVLEDWGEAQPEVQWLQFHLRDGAWRYSRIEKPTDNASPTSP